MDRRQRKSGRQRQVSAGILPAELSSVLIIQSATMAKRTQRQRSKGWKMPPNTVYVGRPTRWGNPFIVGVAVPYRITRSGALRQTEAKRMIGTAAEAVAFYRAWMLSGQCKGIRRQLHRLAGRDLACWCKPDEPCHADVLLEMANSE